MINALNYTVWHPVSHECKAIFKCLTNRHGRWADAAATVGPNWQPELQIENKPKHHD